MPDARLARTRATLPKGYQFGVARDRETGISIRFLRQFDIEPDKFPVRHDYGFNEHGDLCRIARVDAK